MLVIVSIKYEFFRNFVGHKCLPLVEACGLPLSFFLGELKQASTCW
jgi:hypothetical protein